MVDFNRNHFENAIAYVVKHHRAFRSQEEEVRYRLDHLVNQVLLAKGNCLCARDMEVVVYCNEPGSKFKVEIRVDLRPGCPNYVA